jgi:hypothetical protein
MKQYVIDQLRESDYHQIREFLDRSAEATAMEGIYRVDLPAHLYTETQKEHANCHPHYFAVSLDWNAVAFELLIRSLQVIRCNCIAYATPQQREYILDFADCMLSELSIKL